MSKPIVPSQVTAAFGLIGVILGASVVRAQEVSPASLDELDKKLIAVEDTLVQLITTGTGQDVLRWAPKLAEELRHLSQNISNGDFRPTD